MHMYVTDDRIFIIPELLVQSIYAERLKTTGEGNAEDIYQPFEKNNGKRTFNIFRRYSVNEFVFIYYFRLSFKFWKHALLKTVETPQPI